MEANNREDCCCESKFLTLANELIEYICNTDVLNHIDICHLSQTCRRFNAIASSKEVWRTKANQRWSSWKHKPHSESDWKDVFRRRIKCSREMMQHINSVIFKSFKKDCLENGDLKVFGTYCDNIDDEDMKQVENTFHGIISNNRFKMLTLQFYSRKIYIYINQHKLTKKWCTFLCKPDNSQNLIQGTILIAEWCRQLRDVCEDFVHKEIDEIVSKVKEKVAKLEREPSSQMETFTEADKILEAIRIVLFQDIGFHGNIQSYYDVNNSFIDKVLELHTGIPITLSIVVAAVAEKLGIHLEPVNFPMHFLLRYSPSNSSDNCKYIDAYHGGKIMDELDCVQILPFESRNNVPRHALFPTASPRQVFIRMVANIINAYRSSTIIDGRSIDSLRSALELMMLLCPDDEEHRLMLSRVYLHFGVNLDEVIDNLRQLLTSTRGRMQMGLLNSLLDYAVKKQNEGTTTNVSPRYRSDEMNSNVSYYVGMVMHHKRYHYFCVIYGWDNFCNMEENWRIQMGVYNLTDGAEQPFYNVLADDGSCRYASQESLVPLNTVKSSGRPIFHQDIGKYFDEFNGLHYIPNYLLMKSYPEDGEIPRYLLPAVPYEKMNEIEPIDEG